MFCLSKNEPQARGASGEKPAARWNIDLNDSRSFSKKPSLGVRSPRLLTILLVSGLLVGRSRSGNGNGDNNAYAFHANYRGNTGDRNTHRGPRSAGAGRRGCPQG